MRYGTSRPPQTMGPCFYFEDQSPSLVRGVNNCSLDLFRGAMPLVLESKNDGEISRPASLIKQLTRVRAWPKHKLATVRIAIGTNRILG